MVHFKIISNRLYMYHGRKCLRALGKAEDMDIEKMNYLRKQYENKRIETRGRH